MRPAWLTELAEPLQTQVKNKEEISIADATLEPAPANTLCLKGNSSSIGIVQGAILKPIMKAVWEEGPKIQPYFDNVAFSDETDAYNYVHFSSGSYLRIPCNKTSEEPLHITIDTTGNIIDRHLVILEENSKGTLIITHKGDGKRSGVFDVRLAPGSELHLVELQQAQGEQTLYRRATLQKDAILRHTVLGLDAASEERNLFHLAGEGAQIHYKAAQLGTRKRIVNTQALHSARRTTSRMHIRNAAQDKGELLSFTKAIIEPQAQYSDSNLEDHGLLLTKDARIHAIPSLEVHADEVKAGHANSAAPINPEHLFYLTTRGLTEKEAKKTIILSFLESAATQPYIDVHALLESYFKDARSYKEDFPVLSQDINGHTLVYLDSAATSQKPRAVIDAIKHYYEKDNANIHRGMHTLSARSTQYYEEARAKVAQFINASASELVFTRNSTEGLNLLAQTLSTRITEEDTILLTELEHHSNILPWQQLARETGAQLRYVGVHDDGTLNMDSLRTELAKKPAILAITHVSNALGTINPIASITREAHKHGTLVLVDGAQSVPHLPVDVKALDCDALVFSGHKMFGPTGIGGLYVKASLLETLAPYMRGGGMIKEVALDHASYKEGPERFEAGTPNIEGAIALAKAVDYMQAIGMYQIAHHNMELVQYALQELSKLPQVKLYGPSADKRAGVVSFTLGDMHGHDVSEVLDSYGIAIRSGHHCAQPLLERFGVADLCRASFHIYNTKEDVDRLVDGLKKAIEVFKL